MRVLLAVYLLGWITAVTPSEATELHGDAHVTDGDTIELANQRVRIHGIDAPEHDQSCTRGGVEWLCGREAAARLRELVHDRDVTCVAKDRDRYGRIIASCTANGTDLGAQLVADGLALAYRRYSMDYVDAEVSAKAAHRGMWAGQFVAPWEWRQGVRLKIAPANDNETCAIKGNISSSGERIYHVPGSAYYGRTKIDTSRGERWFCSEDDAVTAGWRPSKR